LPTSFADKLQGNWSAMTSSNCLVGVNFVGTGTSVNVVCGNSSTNVIDLQSNQGTFTADAENIYLVMDKSTCPDADKKIYYPYSLTGTTLTLSYDTGVILLVRNTSTGGSGGAATYGCFRMGVFTPSPLAPIP
jgi:hypothetical protein